MEELNWMMNAFEPYKDTSILAHEKLIGDGHHIYVVAQQPFTVSPFVYSTDRLPWHD
jgi:hypothetical protein